jgi:N-acetyl-alpha-D-muramate 1-phosphate uridylyltransferase
MMLPVVILAGGLATRMKPITEKMPKAMLDIDGRPFIYHQLNLLKKKGINRVILCVGFLGEMIESYVGNGIKFQLDVKYSYDGDKLLGTGGAIKKALKYLDDAFFVLYGDSYLEVDYGKIEAAFLKAPAKGLMTVFRNDGKWDTSNVVFRNDEILIYSKRERTEEMNYIDYGLGILSRPVFNNFVNETAFDLAYVYEKLAKEKQLMGYEVFERFYEIGSKEGLKDLQRKIYEQGSFFR